MKVKANILVPLVVFVIVSCTPMPTPALVQTPATVKIATSAPSASSTPIPPTTTAAPTLIPSPTVEVKLVDLPQTKAAVDQFAAAMKSAGVPADADQIRQGLTTKEITGKDGKKYEIALTQDGYPLMIKAGGEKWQGLVGKKAAEVAGLKSFGSLIEYRQDRTLYPELDILYGEHLILGLPLFYGRINIQILTMLIIVGQIGKYQGKEVGIKQFRLHALIYRGEGVNSYFQFTKEQLINEINMTIEKEMIHAINKGVNEFIVVNEAFYPGSGRTDLFYEKIGEEYVKLAFQKAREVADKQGGGNIYLIYNDIQNQYSINPQTKYTLKVIDSLMADKLVDGVGVQMHVNGNSINYQDITDTLNKYNLPVYVTEMDIDMTGISDQKKQASIWEETIKAILASGQCKSITLWGVGDKYSWLETMLGLRNANPTLFDDNMLPKLALYGLFKGMVESAK